MIFVFAADATPPRQRDHQALQPLHDVKGVIDLGVSLFA